MMDMLAEVEWIEDYFEEEEEQCRGSHCMADEDAWRFDLHSDMLKTSRDLGVIWKARPLLTLPENATHVDYLLENGIKYLEYNRSVRDLKWLEENGLCLDNLKPGESTIRQAGRGAFASRHIPKGEVVVPMPLIHIPDRSIYNMYGSIVAEDPRYHSVKRNVSDIIGYQLLLNYCFGHSQSTLLLCPYGAGASLINHPISKDKANVRLQWSTKGTRHPEWLEHPIDQWGETQHTGLAFDVVALRDIVEDEEVFLWYGDEWEAAWKKHVETWQPPPGSHEYEPSLRLNEMYDIPIRTVSEGSYHPENDKILYCRDVYLLLAGARSPSPYEFHACRALDRYLGPDDEFRYLVETYTEVEGKAECWEDDLFVLFDLPRDGFHFRDALYSLDHSQEWAFRHDLRIPDELMPEQWLNAR